MPESGKFDIEVESMIKMIASDLDGTLLLDGAQSLSPDIIPIIKKLKEKGILFVAASGRQYPNLRRLFAPVADDIGYICENGALIKYQGKTLYKSVIPRELAMEVVDAIVEREGCEALVSGENTSYIVPKDPYYEHHLRYEVKNDMTTLQDFREVTEEIMKVSVCEFSGIEKGDTVAVLNEKFADRLYTTVSGLAWQDFISIGTNKGSAIAILEEALGISAPETMAFGDNYNDIEMLQHVGVPIAMEKSPDALKAIASMISSRVEDTLTDYFHL